MASPIKKTTKTTQATAKALTARDLMQSKVVSLRSAQPIQEALELLEEHAISGAPVVDGGGNLVGVLSRSDIARSDRMRGGRIEDRGSEWDLAYGSDDELEQDDLEGVLEGKDDYNPELRGTDTVGDWMNRALITVAPDADLRDVCRMLHERGVHRLMVVEERKLVGIVSTMDVVRMVAEGRIGG